MKKSLHIQELAAQTWPLFERKWRRMLFWKKWLKKLIFIAASATAVSLGLLLYPTNSLKIEKSGPKSAPHIIDDKTARPPKSQQQTPLLHIGKFKFGFSDSAHAPNLDDHFMRSLQKQTPPLLKSSHFVLVKKADLYMAFALLNFEAQIWSLQANGHSLAVLIDSKTLMIMNLMYGSEKLPAYPSDLLEESLYRPAFFPADQYIHIHFYDVSDWIQDPLSAQVLINRPNQQIPLAPWRTSSNPNSTAMANLFMINTFDKENPGLFVYRGLDPKYNRSAQTPYRRVIYVADRPAEAFNPILFHRNDTLLVVSAQAQKVTQLSENGVIYTANEITYKSNGIQSVKRREPLIDPVDNTLYVLAPTNFHFVIYKVDCNSGLAQQVYQTASVWKGAEFEIFAQQLIFNYKGQTQRIQLP